MSGLSRNSQERRARVLFTSDIRVFSFPSFLCSRSLSGVCGRSFANMGYLVGICLWPILAIRRALLEQAVPESECGSSCTRRKAQLGEEAMDVAVNGVAAQN